jgi:hypothetical protein
MKSSVGWISSIVIHFFTPSESPDPFDNGRSGIVAKTALNNRTGGDPRPGRSGNLEGQGRI